MCVYIMKLILINEWKKSARSYIGGIEQLENNEVIMKQYGVGFGCIKLGVKSTT